MKRIVIGMLAHVDSGKTTLSEALLYSCGAVRNLGRVDHGNAFLDNDTMERKRGITIFSKQANIRHGDTEFVILDTPGHVDFSSEMERTLQVLDYAVLVISGTDGVQSHTETLWQLLIRYNIPTFIFVNKMDISFLAKESLIKELKKRLSHGCICFDTSIESIYEELAECSETMMNSYLDDGVIKETDIIEAVRRREVFPCCFGSALKLSGVETLLDVIGKYSAQPEYSDAFGAKVYKITRDEQGNRLTHLKVTGGSLKVRSVIDGPDWQEKVNQIRIYSGVKFTAVDELPAGGICAVTGLNSTYAGQGLGIESSSLSPVLEPVLTYKIILRPEYDTLSLLSQLRRLEEQDPQLHIIWNEHLQEIHLRLMGEIQLEILKTMISQQFGLDVEFDQGSITYKETISAPVIGMGHYEPLRHYAEVQLLMEPAERGTGLQFGTDLQRDSLDINWQRLILTHLEEKTHIGVLTGSPITDMKITLVAGKAHLKHTEGGDFRQATYRAVRHGLRCAESVLLEPWYDFKLEVPNDCVGRALTDLQLMECSETEQRTDEQFTVISGSAPVAKMRDYHKELLNYTHGKGRLSCISKGFFPCHDADEVTKAIGYCADSDVDNSADSVFCSHGAGVVVKWDEAASRMHCDSGIRFGGSDNETTDEYSVNQQLISSYKQRMATDKELMEIFERTYGKIDRDPRRAMRNEKQPQHTKIPKLAPLPKGPEFLLVDGYNIIFAWDELKNQAKDNLDLARNSLINILCNYQGFRQCNLILVFDAYKVKGNHREIEKIGGINVVYTKEAETADMYIEKVAHKLGKDHRVRVATSDNVEQLIIMGSGGIRVSASEFYDEVKLVEKTIRELIGG